MGKAGKPGKPKQQHKVKVLHPNSRKAAKVTGTCMRKQRIQRAHTETALKQTLLLDKLQWFKDNRDDSKDSYTKTDMVELVKRYIHRFDDELEQIEIIHGMKSRKNRQHAAREDVIRMTMKREEQAFNTSGIEMPDLCDAKNLELFLKWDGTSKHAHLIKMRLVKLSDSSLSSKQVGKHKGAKNEDKGRKEEEDKGRQEEEDASDEQSDDQDNKIDENERTDSMDVDMTPDS
ncbi:translation machinery-associated protein 16-like [Amphiura filiformis]|uniref:translation machinery-associated protein 16-like n=1 Tax=Amphiura filiformis TaxID=82378 RepID=UPI003B2231B7